MAWDAFPLTTVGDSLGVFPLAYLARHKHAAIVGDAVDAAPEAGASSHDANAAATPSSLSIASMHEADADLELALSVASNYLMPYPDTLPDGTFARRGGCCNGGVGGGSAPPPGGAAPQPEARYLWADDQFMGLAVLSRLATEASLPRPARLSYARRVARLQLQFTQYLRDPTDGLNAHGAYVPPAAGGASGAAAHVRHSCCKWGRANGWGMLSHVEVLDALEGFPRELGAEREAVRADFVRGVDAMLAAQDGSSGMWRQVVNDSSTFLETSVTAMMVAALATGLERRWLPSSVGSDSGAPGAHSSPGTRSVSGAGSSYAVALQHAWAGLAARVLPNGTVTGVCMGTGMMSNASEYNARGTDYMQSPPGGVGAVLRAAVAMATYLDGAEGREGVPHASVAA